MDLPEENASCNSNDDGENEFDNGSSYNEGEALDAKQSSNVNSSPSQWPLRHNNHNESLERHNSYSCNGFRQAKKPRYTYTGRISRIPSRYLDTDSDSGDGSVRKDGQSRLKVKRSRRRRKLPSSNSKLHVNGFKEHEDALLLSVADFEVHRIADNLGEQECLTNIEFPDVFEDTSPISNDKISHVAHETQDKSTSDPNALLSNEIMCLKTSKLDAVNGEPVIVDNFCSKSEQTAEHSLTSPGCCVDISSKNNGRPRFESSMKSKEETTLEIHEQTLATCSTTLVNTPYKRNNLHEASKGDSSRRQTVVSPKQISNDCQVSCAIHNDNTGSFLERQNCKNCKECTLNSSYISAENTQHTENNEFELSGKIAGDIGRKLSKKKRLVKTTKKLSKKLALKDKLNDSESNTLSTQAEGLECLKDLKMRKALAKKLKLRRNEKTDKNNVLKRNRKNGVICKVKQKSFGKVNAGKVDKQTNKMNRKVNKVTKVKDTEVTKSSEHSEELDRVLGMRRSPNGIYEFLVQWRNGTSCWVSSDEIVTDKHNYYLREYLVECEQDVSVVNRVPFQAYCCDSLSLKECMFASKSKKALRKMLCAETVEKTVCEPPVGSAKKKHDVSIEYDESYCYITLNRETCKRKSTCLKIMLDLITALEDAATSECEVVIIRGLRSDVLCGMKLDDMSKTGVEKDNVILSQARYLVQTLTNYPKLLVALISKSAEGIGAVILSLFDMICDEETWGKKQILNRCEDETKEDKKIYTLPRLSGHSSLSEEILMGRHIGTSEPCDPTSACESCLADTSTVTSTLMEIEATLRLLGKRTSLLQVNGELFPSTKPSFALFADIKHGVSSIHEGGSCLNDSVEGSTMVDHDQSLSTHVVDDYFLADENKRDRVSDGNPISDQIVAKVNTTTDFSKYHSHPVTEQSNVDHASTDHGTMDHVITREISMNHTTTDQSKIEQASTDQSTVDDVMIDQSKAKHINIYQSTAERTVDYTNTDHSSMELCTMDQSIAVQNTSDQTSTDQRTMDYTTTTVDQSTENHANTDHNTLDHTTITIDHSTNDHAISDQSTIDQEVDDNAMLDVTVVDQTITACTATTDTCAPAESVVEIAFDDRSIDNVSDTSTSKTTDSIVKHSLDNNASDYIASDHETAKNSSIIQETHLNQVDNMNDENSLNQNLNLSTVTECTVTKDTNLIQSSTDSKLNDVTMASGEITDGIVNHTRSDCSKIDSNQHSARYKNNLITNIDEITSGPVKTDYNCTENMDSTSYLRTAVCDTSNKCINDNNTTERNDVTSEKYIVGNDIIGKLNSNMQNIRDTGGEKMDKDPTILSRTENYANTTNTSDNMKLMSQNETSEYGYCNTIKVRHGTGNTEMTEDEKTNEQVNKLAVLDTDTSNTTKQMTTNDIDIDITNYPSTIDSFTSDHLETIPHAVTDPIPDNTTEHTSVNDCEISASTSSAAAAVDRYLKKLEAQVEAEKRQAQRYIEQISRLWDNPFLYNN